MGNTEQIHSAGLEENSADCGRNASPEPSEPACIQGDDGRNSSKPAPSANSTTDFSKTMVMDEGELNKAAEKARKDRQTTHPELNHEKTKSIKPYDKKFRSNLTQWLQSFRTTFDSRSATDFVEPNKVDVNSLADIQAAVDLKDEYASLKDNFTILREIATGGQGTISRALDKHCARTVAIKTLHKNLQKSEIARKLFLTEAQITAQLEHPSIIPIYGIYGDEDNGLHLAMKLVRGRSLQEYLNAVCSLYDNATFAYVRRSEAMNLKKRLGYFINVIDAISYVHHKNVIHKDLKPENIMLGAFGETYVMDWGISEKVDTEHKPKKPSGTLQYIAPEVINCEGYDTRSDIYLLGLILYDITFLRPAYESENDDDAVRIAKEADVAPYRHRYGCPVDSDLQYILDKALAVNPDERYQKAEQMGKDIRAYLQGDVVSASPYQKLAKMFKYFRSHVKMLFVLFIILIALFFGSNFFLINKAYGASQRKLKEKNLATHLTNTSLRYADEFTQVTDRCERFLQLTAREASLRLKLTDKDAPLPPRTSMSPIGETPKTAIYAPTYGFRNVSFDTGAYIVPPNVPKDEVRFYLAALHPLFDFISENLPEVCMSNEVFNGMDRNEIIMYMTQHKRPAIFSIYIGLKNGMILTYPFVEGQKTNYDVRTRPWYTAAEVCAEGNVTMVEPYTDKAWSAEPVFTMSIPLFAQNNEFCGVLAIDITEKFLREKLENGRNRKLHNSRTMLVNRQAQIMLDTHGRLQFNIDGSRMLFYAFPDKEVFNRFSSLRNASITMEQCGTNYLYVYSYIKLADWFFVEQINFSKYTDFQ